MPMHTMFIFLLLLSTWTISLMYIWMHSWGLMKLTVFVPAWKMVYMAPTIMINCTAWLLIGWSIAFIIFSYTFFFSFHEIYVKSRMRWTTNTIVVAISMAAFWESNIMRWLIRYFFYNNLLIQRHCFPPKITFFILLYRYWCIRIFKSMYMLINE